MNNSISATFGIIDESSPLRVDTSRSLDDAFDFEDVPVITPMTISNAKAAKSKYANLGSTPSAKRLLKKARKLGRSGNPFKFNEHESQTKNDKITSTTQKMIGKLFGRGRSKTN